MIYRMV